MDKAVDTISRFIGRSRPELGFSAEHSVASWQRQLRAKLLEISGIAALQAEGAPMAVRADGSATDMGSYTRQRFYLRTTVDYELLFYLLKPKGDGPFVPMVAQHGHGQGASNVVGLASSEVESRKITYHNYAYGVEAVERGYLVAVPDKRGFGESVEGLFDCRMLASHAVVAGLSVIGLHTWDNVCLLDYLLSRDDVRPGPAGCIGLSGGGSGTLWLAAMDERIGAAVIAGHLADYDMSGEGPFGCVCNAVPDLLKWADRSDIAGLIAPRTLVIESASQDECYSRARTLAAYESLSRIYQAAGAADHLRLTCFTGHHEWSGVEAWPIIDRALSL